ncbi:MAG: zinc ABC transporter substrate-binding protein, partial [Cryobacterium sp.]|nr:zinc ABC transporter substrate-binding protein [Cryobacterium sp.]
LALTEADVIISNGGGYDPFIDALLGDHPTAHVLVAVELSGLLPEGTDHEDDHDHAEEDHAEDDQADHDHGDDHADHDHDHGDEGHDHGDEDDHSDHDHDGHNHIEGFNEHVWYDLGTAQRLAAALAEVLAEIDADNAETYSANAQEFHEAVDALLHRAHELEDEFGHLHVVLTEPAPQYLIELVGAHNITPEAFTSAVEAGFDIPPAALLEVLRLVESGEADLVAWNEQTSGPQLERVADAARGAGVPVISVTETLPPGLDYLGWMDSNLDAIASALRP